MSIRHRLGKDSINQGLLLEGGVRVFTPKTFPPNAEGRFRDLSKIRRALILAGDPILADINSQKSVSAWMELRSAKDFLEDKKAVRRTMREDEVSKLKELVRELYDAFNHHADPDVLERLGNAISALMPNEK